ncbi:hypothetical protein [Pseudomonas cavernicola]|uniref:hypothetical protein n=1 Tax=Pseudomonas cavernicola TaxID=2320866 RepID=UPI001314BCCE|nr:hypothetical protein [Pseudomonas cavernicola]
MTMNIGKHIASLLLLAGIASTQALAATGGTISFVGAIVEPPCSISTNASGATLNLSGCSLHTRGATLNIQPAGNTQGTVQLLDETGQQAPSADMRLLGSTPATGGNTFSQSYRINGQPPVAGQPKAYLVSITYP